MSLFFNVLKSENQAIHDQALTLAAKNMPGLMGEAQIREYEDSADKMSALVAHKQANLEQAQKEAAPKIAAFNQFKNAYDRLVTQAESMGIEVDNPSPNLSGDQKEIVAALNDALAKATALKPAKKDAEHRVEQAQHDLDDMRRDADAATQRAVTARQRSKDKQEEMERLAAEEERENQRVHDAKVAAGLTHGIDGAHMVDDAMDAEIARRRERVAAAHQTADSYNKAHDAASPASTTNRFLADALAAGNSPTASAPVDLKSRRAALDD